MARLRARRREIAIGAAAAGGSLMLAGCSAVDIANALTPRAGYALRRDLAYGDGPRRRLDLYLPDDDAWALLVFLYGGNWQAGRKEAYRFVAQSFAAHGIAVAIPDYRLYPEVRFPGFLEDGAAALAWLAREREGLGIPAAAPVVLMGHSAGAYIAAMLALDERWLARAGAPRPAGWIGLAGPYDFLPLRAADLRDIFHADRDPAGLPATQPIAYADGTDPPARLLTGDADETVRPGNSRRLAARLREAGGAAELVEYPGVGHIGIVAALAAPLRPFSSPVLRDCVGFVERLAGRPVTAAPRDRGRRVG